MICLVVGDKTELAEKLWILNMSIYVRSLVAMHYYRAYMQIRVLKIHSNSIDISKYIVKYCDDNLFKVSCILMAWTLHHFTPLLFYYFLSFTPNIHYSNMSHKKLRAYFSKMYIWYQNEKQKWIINRRRVLSNIYVNYYSHTNQWKPDKIN